MCGLLGYLGPDIAAVSPRLEQALLTMVHRGPDGDGSYKNEWLWLGHRRLAILDLTSAGLQPFWGVRRETVLLYNGEIYNFEELRTELRGQGVAIVGGGDTAVLMAALDTWGVAATVSKLNGFWAFAYIELAKRAITLSRDRFGVKPLYFAAPSADSFVFASEPKAIISAFPQFRRADEDVVTGYIEQNDFFRNGRSFYDGIRVFPPASYAVFAPGSAKIDPVRYWSYPAQVDEAVDLNKQYEEFAALFEDAVHIRYRSDVPVGLTLSGGVDSTAILLASEKRKFAGLRSYTAIYDRGTAGEMEHAKAVAHLVDVSVDGVICPSSRWIEELRSLCSQLDSPTASPAVLPLRRICRVAKQDGVTVLLEGQGADEAFTGYAQHAAAWSLDAITGQRQGGGAISLLASLPAFARTFGAIWYGMWLAKMAAPQLARMIGQRASTGPRLATASEGKTPQVLMSESGPDHTVERSRLGALLRREHGETILPTLLHYGDAVSMSESVEMRQPFLDYRLVDWVFSRGWGSRIVNGQTKWVIRKFIDDHGAGFVNDWQKEGFTTPLSAWISQDAQMITNDLLCGPNSRVQESVRKSDLRSLVSNAVRGSKTASYHVFRLVALELWRDTLRA